MNFVYRSFVQFYNPVVLLDLLFSREKERYIYRDNITMVYTTLGTAVQWQENQTTRRLYTEINQS